MASPFSLNGTATQPQAGSNGRPSRPPRPNYKHIHRFPLPVTIHPLPTLIPHNPLSVISVVLSYLTYLVSAPKKEIYSAYFDAATSSVHVTDPKAVRALWEMGFFGRGILSRSEPSWLEREKKRRGLLALGTSEEVTGERRVERREMKLERARKEQEAIAQQLKEEAAKRNSVATTSQLGTKADNVAEQTNGSINGSVQEDDASLSDTALHRPNGTHRVETSEQKLASSTKSVRFSSIVEEKKYTPETDIRFSADGSVYQDRPAKITQDELINEEHLQLQNEEALFLVYGLGSLQIFDRETNSVIPATSLIKLFTRHSTFPARPETDLIQPDDPFLVSYVAYHHFRSLGWVVRSGVKFGTDYLLYNRGPVFAHAEFAVLILPSYENSYWESTPQLRDYSARKQSRSWWWLHGVNRVQAQVQKTLVLCFVDIPPPLTSRSLDNIGETLRRYKVRDVLVRRWVPNRSRD